MFQLFVPQVRGLLVNIQHRRAIFPIGGMMKITAGDAMVSQER